MPSTTFFIRKPKEFLYKNTELFPVIRPEFQSHDSTIGSVVDTVAWGLTFHLVQRVSSLNSVRTSFFLRQSFTHAAYPLSPVVYQLHEASQHGVCHWPCSEQACNAQLHKSEHLKNDGKHGRPAEQSVYQVTGTTAVLFGARENSSLRYNFHNGSGHRSPSCLRAAEALSSEIKRQGRELKHSPVSS
jgi:hypothetical protein